MGLGTGEWTAPAVPLTPTDGGWRTTRSRGGGETGINRLYAAVIITI